MAKHLADFELAVKDTSKRKRLKLLTPYFEVPVRHTDAWHPAAGETQSCTDLLAFEGL